MTGRIDVEDAQAQVQAEELDYTKGMRHMTRRWWYAHAESAFETVPEGLRQRSSSLESRSKLIPPNRHTINVNEDTEKDFPGGEPGFYVLERCGSCRDGMPKQLRAHHLKTYPFSKGGGILRLGIYENGEQNAWTNFAVPGNREDLIRVVWAHGERTRSETRGCIPVSVDVVFDDGGVQVYQVISKFILLHRHVEEVDVFNMIVDLFNNDYLRCPGQFKTLKAPSVTEECAEEVE